MVNLYFSWKSIVLVLYPLLLLPIILVNVRVENKCLYVTCLMIGYWLTRVVPPAITGLLPVLLFPLMTIEETYEICPLYLHWVNMLFFGDVVMALAIQRSNLHQRLFFAFLKLVGFSFRKFHFVLFIYTTFLSMWIPNVMVTLMMIPLLQTILVELESHEIHKTYEDDFLESDFDMPFRRPSKFESHEIHKMRSNQYFKSDEEMPHNPTRLTRCLYLSTAYAATIGGVGNLIGTPTNLALLGVYLIQDPQSEDITFNHWIAKNILLMVIMMCFTCLLLQIWYLGLFRPKSSAARALHLDEETRLYVKDIMFMKLKELGPVTFYEVLVGVLFLLLVLLWFFRWPNYFHGWSYYLTNSKVTDCCAVVLMVVLLFALPARLDFIHAFDKQEMKRPAIPTQPAMVWRYVHERMLWELLFILGGCFSIAKGIISSNLDNLIVDSLKTAIETTKLSMLVLLCGIAVIATQFARNAIVASCILPFLPSVAEKLKCHPLYLMIPVCLVCSFGFCLPMSTPSNEKVMAVCRLRTMEFVRVGILVTLVAFFSLVIIFPVMWPYG